MIGSYVSTSVRIELRVAVFICTNGNKEVETFVGVSDAVPGNISHALVALPEEQTLQLVACVSS